MPPSSTHLTLIKIKQLACEASEPAVCYMYTYGIFKSIIFRCKYNISFYTINYIPFLLFIYLFI